MVNSSGLKWSVFIVQKLALNKNGVEFRQQFNGAIDTVIISSCVHTDKQCIQHSKDQNSYFGMSVDIAVVGTGQRGIQKE